MNDGAVLPILHLNGYKIANPTLLARIGRDELEHLMRGYGYEPYFVAGHDPEMMHQLLAETLDKVVPRSEQSSVMPGPRKQSPPALAHDCV